MRNEAAVFILALQFLTRLPVRSVGLYTPDRMAASVRYHPLVGMLVGALSGAVYGGVQLVLPHSLAVVAAIAAGLLITGAFHEDGLADTFDGIGGGQDRNEILTIMRDSRLGSYGTLALMTVLALKVGGLAALPPRFVMAALIAGHGLSRLSSVLAMTTGRPVREKAAGQPVAEGLSAAGLTVALLTGAAILAGWVIWLPPAAMAVGCIGLLVGHVTMRLSLEPRLGGYTGDTLGAVQQTSELGFYLGAAAWF